MQAPFTILLADNDLEQSDILNEQVKNNTAFDCIRYKTEKELFSILNHTLPQLLIYDLTLPGIESRLTLLQKIHQDYPELLIIAVIPDGAEDLIESVLQLDLFFYIHKPYDPAEIRIALKRAQSILSRRSPNVCPHHKRKKSGIFLWVDWSKSAHATTL